MWRQISQGRTGKGAKEPYNVKTVLIQVLVSQWDVIVCVPTKLNNIIYWTISITISLLFGFWCKHIGPTLKVSGIYSLFSLKCWELRYLTYVVLYSKYIPVGIDL